MRVWMAGHVTTLVIPPTLITFECVFTIEMYLQFYISGKPGNKAGGYDTIT